MYRLYKALTGVSAPLLEIVLKKRVQKGKEDPNRFHEKKAQTNKNRPEGELIWLHAASVGEAQSALIVIEEIISINHEINILVTTGTLTSAEMMAKKLPSKAIHQFAPLDHPKWVRKFLDHWRPNYALWMESELWPNMLHELKARQIKTVLINGHMSKKSYNSWSKALSLSKTVLGCFTKILCQTEKDKERFESLGAKNVVVTDNLKYSAVVLDYNELDLKNLQEKIGERKLWLYASTHKGEETLACEVHKNLITKYPDLLTIIVPRHPERRDEIKQTLISLKCVFRGKKKDLPDDQTQIYVADTLGELGLFYKLTQIACIGRSFSDDGGGGHNPIEAAQLDCAVIHGPNVHNLQDIFDDMNSDEASIKVKEKSDLAPLIDQLLSEPEYCERMKKNAKEFSYKKTSVIKTVMSELHQILKAA